MKYECIEASSIAHFLIFKVKLFQQFLDQQLIEATYNKPPVSGRAHRDHFTLKGVDASFSEDKKCFIFSEGPFTDTNIVNVGKINKTF